MKKVATEYMKWNILQYILENKQTKLYIIWRYSHLQLNYNNKQKIEASNCFWARGRVMELGNRSEGPSTTWTDNVFS